MSGKDRKAAKTLEGVPEVERTEVAPFPEGEAQASPSSDRTHFVPSDDNVIEADEATIPPSPMPQAEGTHPPGFAERTQLSAGDDEPFAASSPAADVPTAAPGIGIGTLINNNYEVQQVLKAGGMGEVYRGIEIGTGDPVAIKAVLPELAVDEKAGLLFKREAKTLRQLTDDAIVRYYNYVHDRDLDRYFLVMEFIEGIPLSDHLQQYGALSVQAALNLMMRLAKGLAKAHAQEVVHRDLSPDNVMLPESDVRQARLIDFGIAKSNIIQESTMRGQFAGKFKFVAPEQLGHFDGEIGPAADIYGLGLLIAAAAMGQSLDMGSSIVEAVKSRQSVPDLSSVPKELVPIIHYMLQPNPARRPASMDEVQAMLENPNLIPLEYRQGLPPPPIVSTTGRGSLPTNPPTAPLGLQVPSPGYQNAATTTRTTIPVIEEERSGIGGTLATLAFLAVLGGGGWYAWEAGLLPFPQEADEALLPVVENTGIPLPDLSTRAGFLASFDTGPCTFTNRIAAGANAGMIEGYSSTNETFSGLPVAYEEQFGARPAILPRQVTPEQCAALDFAKALQGRAHPEIAFQMFTDQVASDEDVAGEIRTTGEQSIWPVLIAPNGGVFSLADRTSDPVNWQRSLRFGMRLEEGAEDSPQLVLVVSSDVPLATAATAQPGARASELLPLVLDEIAEKNGAASAALSFILLTQDD